MPDIPITDSLSAVANIQIEDGSFLAKSQLSSLSSATAPIVAEFEGTLDQIKFQSATFGGKFKSPSLISGADRHLVASAGANAALKLIRPSARCVFNADDYDPIPIKEGQFWMAFEIDTSLELAAGVAPGGGFGVGLSVSTTPVMAAYTRVAAGDKLMPSVCAALSNFALLTSSADIRAQKPGTILVASLSGRVTLSGSWSFPFSINGLSLAGANLPFNQRISVAPTATATLKGSLSLIGEYAVRSYRVTEDELHLGVYRKKGSELEVGFTASAGLAGNLGSTDLIPAVLGAIAPGVHPEAVGLTEGDADLIAKALKASVNRSLSISLNLACSASAADEAAILYSADLSKNRTETDAALDAALNGDWTGVSTLPNARKLRDVTVATHETTHRAVFNLLGVYNFASLEAFLRSCKVVHDEETGSITITDSLTAKRISTATSPWLANPERLRSALYEGFVATAAYCATNASGKLGAELMIRQHMLIYADQLDRRHTLKNLLPGVALHLMTAADLNAIAPTVPAVHHVRISAIAQFNTAGVLALFFSDVQKRTSRTEADLIRLGRNILSALLDRDDPVDDVRWKVLHDDDAWGRMDRNDFEGIRSCYPDYIDITWWADAVSKVGPRLADVLGAVDATTGADPSKDADFMKKRQKLAQTLDEVTRNTHAAFEKGWPIVAMVTLSGFSASPTFDVSWDGKRRFPAIAETPLTASGS